MLIALDSWATPPSLRAQDTLGDSKSWLGLAC